MIKTGILLIFDKTTIELYKLSEHITFNWPLGRLHLPTVTFLHACSSRTLDARHNFSSFIFPIDIT